MLTARTITTTPKPGRRGAPRATPLPHPAHSNDPRVMAAIREAMARVEGEYREMPGLSLTAPQAARLWGMDRSTCDLVLANLMKRGVLKRASNGTYVRR
jgi:hypothetical protein